MTDQPRHASASSATAEELDDVVKLAYEWGQLKRLPRTGWLRAGIKHPETVAEHSLRTAMLAWVLAGLEGANPERAATLALFHDSGESRTTDIDHVGRNYLHATSNEQITTDQTEALPRPLAALLRGIIADYESRASLEADCARDADKLEMLLQALEYRQEGHGSMAPFVQTAVAALRTESGRRLGEAALRTDPATWWQTFAKPIAAERLTTRNGQ